jgi:hypothetical protein
MNTSHFLSKPILWASLALAVVVGTSSVAEAQWGSRYGGSRSYYGQSRSNYGNYGSGRVYHAPNLHYDRTYHADSLHWTPRRGLHTHGHYDVTPHYTPGHYDYRHGNHVHGNRYYHR